MKSGEKRIADSLKPTSDNVIRHFLVYTMNEILFGEDYPNFRFDFREPEAISYIKSFYQNYPNGKEFFGDRFGNIVNMLTDESLRQDNITPVMVVNDYKSFLGNLRAYYEEIVEHYWKRSPYSAFPVYEMENCFTDIWLRATPDDFNNPERFLEKQVMLAKDKTLEKYDEEVSFGAIEDFDNNILCVKNGYARTWDEAQREFQITIYDKEHYENKRMIYKPHYMLPVIRYGIYENDGKKVCYIGSVQNTLRVHPFASHEAVRKKVDRSKYSVNQGVPQEDIEGIEPKQIIALSIFFNILNKEGITDFEVPAFPVLDYDYHIKRNEKLLRDFIKRWTPEEQAEHPASYEEEKTYLESNYGNEDLVSKIKTERLMKTMSRMLQHYPNGEITSYPWDADSKMRFRIPTIKSKDDISGDFLKKLYGVVIEKKQHEDIEF